MGMFLGMALQTNSLHITPEILALISEIDESRAHGGHSAHSRLTDYLRCAEWPPSKALAHPHVSKAAN